MTADDLALSPMCLSSRLLLHSYRLCPLFDCLNFILANILGWLLAFLLIKAFSYSSIAFVWQNSSSYLTDIISRISLFIFYIHS